MNNSLSTVSVYSGAGPSIGRSKITNVSARWEPGSAAPLSNAGISTAYFSMNKGRDYYLKMGVIRAPKGALSLLMSYGSPQRKVIGHPMSLPEGKYVYMEIAVNPKTSNVTFWINDMGQDMGMLPGFKGGADKFSFFGLATPDTHLISGKFTNCAFATASGWKQMMPSLDNVKSSNLHPSHIFDVSGHSMVFGDRRSIA